MSLTDLMLIPDGETRRGSHTTGMQKNGIS